MMFKKNIGKYTKKIPQSGQSTGGSILTKIHCRPEKANNAPLQSMGPKSGAARVYGWIFPVTKWLNPPGSVLRGSAGPFGVSPQFFFPFFTT